MQSEKITRVRRKEEKRRYDDACGTAHGLELIGERWALLVLRELMLGPRRFTELKADLPGISANVLTQRLGELEARGLVEKKRLPPPANVQVYDATDWGREAEPIVQALGRWAARSPQHDPALPISGVSVLLSFRTMFDAGRAGDLECTIAFLFGDDRYFVRITGGELTAHRGKPESADLTVTADPTGLAAVVYGGASADSIAIDGDAGLFARFADIFHLPPKAVLPGG